MFEKLKIAAGLIEEDEPATRMAGRSTKDSRGDRVSTENRAMRQDDNLDEPGRTQDTPRRETTGGATSLVDWDGDPYIYEGELKNGQPHGIGYARWDDGTEYEGSFRYGLFHGQGRLTDSEGTLIEGVFDRNMLQEGKHVSTESVYEGELLNNLPHGKGKLVYKDGTVYEGEFYLGARSGHGKCTYANGSTYEGEWLKDRRHGKGKKADPSGVVYDGGWRSDREDGSFTVTMAEGFAIEGIADNALLAHGDLVLAGAYKFTGDMVDGLPNGKGAASWENGDAYEGSWNQGNRNGWGKMSYSNGDLYEGNWRDDERDGFGEYVYVAGDDAASGTYQGGWKAGKRHGRGTMAYRDGQVYSGEWMDDRWYGMGVLVNRDGEVVNGEWEDTAELRAEAGSTNGNEDARRHILRDSGLVVDCSETIDVDDLLFVSGEKTDTAWGPVDRALFSYGDEVPYRTFNSVVNHPLCGDERYFVFVRKVESGSPFTKSVDAEPGQYYEVCILFRNDASTALNDSGKGIGNGVRASVAIPFRVEADKRAAVSVKLRTLNTAPSEIWDVAAINATSDLCLKYVKNSALLHSRGDVDGTRFEGTALLSEQGVLLGYWKSNWGIVPAGDLYAGFVTFELKAEPAPKVENDPTSDGRSAAIAGKIVKRLGEEIIESVVEAPVELIGGAVEGAVKEAIRSVLPI